MGDENREESSPPVPEIDIEKEPTQRALAATRSIMSREEASISVKEEFAMSRKNLLKGISEIAKELQDAETDEEKAKLAEAIKSEMAELKSLSRREAQMVTALHKKKSNKRKTTAIKKRPSVRSVVSLSETIIEEDVEQSVSPEATE